LLRTLALLLETEERLPTTTAQIRARVADTALEPQIADATAAIQLARFTTRPIPEICAMGGITLKDFSQSMAYKEIFGLGEQRGRELGLEQGLRKAWSKVSKPANSRSPCASYGAAAVPSPPRRRPWLRPCLTFKARTTSTLGGQLAVWVPRLCLPSCRPPISASLWR
jgi:hypothetical protein